MSATTSTATAPQTTPLARQWIRFLNIVLIPDRGENIGLGDLRCTFDVRQFDRQSPNTADIFVYNLSDTTKARLRGEFTKVSVRAGYQSNFAPIFEGSIKQFRSGRQSSTDTFLNIRAADGDVAYTQGTIQTTLAAGASAEDIVAAILVALAPLGVTRGQVSGLPTTRSIRAVVLSGMVRDVLRELCQGWNLVWSIQNGRLDIRPVLGRPDNRDAIVLNSATGMIGRPEQTIEGIKVRCLLNPQITVGRVVHINNTSVQRGQYDLSNFGAVQNEMLERVRVTEDGFYRVISIDHVGDTHGQEWYSEIVCIAVGDPITIPQAQRGRS